MQREQTRFIVWLAPLLLTAVVANCGGADKVTVKLSDGREFTGTVRRDFRSDIALEKINASSLVAAELESRWNETLVRLNEGQAELERLRAERPVRLNLEQQRELMARAQDLPATWNHPATSSEIKKRILRTVLNEIVASVTDDRITLVLHWAGGDHTELRFKRNTSGQHRWGACWKPR